MADNDNINNNNCTDTCTRADVRKAILETCLDIAKETDPMMAMLGMILACKVEEKLFPTTKGGVA